MQNKQRHSRTHGAGLVVHGMNARHKMGGGSSGSQTFTQENEPWDPQKPHLRNAFGRAEELYTSGGPQMYEGSLVAPFSAETQQAQAMRSNRAMTGSDLTRGAKGYTQNTLSGEYLNSNPWLGKTFAMASDPVVRQFQRAVRPGVDSSAERSGRWGSNFHSDRTRESEEVLGETLGNMATSIYGGDYAAERGRMEAAAGRAPGLDAMDYADIDQLAAVGAEKESMGEAQIGEAAARHDFEQNRPFTALDRYLQSISGGYGGSQTTTQPIYRNRAAGAAGGALTGSQLAGMGGINPWLGAAGGALLGYM